VVDEGSDNVTRLGPESGGRDPGDPNVRVYSWEWGTGRWDAGQDRRPSLPWLGVFLLVFGGLLLLQQAYPQSQSIWALLELAIGLAFLIRWAVQRGSGSLYLGAIITALAVPNVAENAGFSRDGFGTLCFGIAFLFIALVRAVGGGGIGWQALIGGLLAIVGAVNLTTPEIGGLILPLALVVIGGLIVLGAVFRPETRQP
jgi:hypothetical protein